MRYLSARAGGAAKAGKPEAIAESRRDLAAERIACYVEKVLAQAPPLSAAQQDRLTVLLRGAS